MGRGRAKAKQTKVARELKYSSPETDYERLQRELSGAAAPSPVPDVDGPVVDDETEDDDDATDPEDDWAPPGR